jgi:hypothetical protein
LWKIPALEIPSCLVGSIASSGRDISRPYDVILRGFTRFRQPGTQKLGGYHLILVQVKKYLYTILTASRYDDKSSGFTSSDEFQLDIAEEQAMFKRLIRVVVIVMCALPFSTVIGADFSDDHSHIRFVQLASDIQSVSILLEDGRTVISGMTPGTSTDYLLYVINRSTLITFTMVSPEGVLSTREWSVPPLSGGYYSAVLIGSSRDNTVEMTIIDEDAVCEGKSEVGACIIMVNNLRSSIPLTFAADNSVFIERVGYRHTVVNTVPATSYGRLVGLDSNNVMIFDLQQPGIYAPNIIHFYGLVGTYPGQMFTDYGIVSTRRVATDIMTFLRGLTADLELTDGETFFSLENIVAILNEAGFGELLSNQQQTFTVFAPTDDAVLRAPIDIYACVTSNPEALRALILNHILVGVHTSTDLVDAETLPTMAGTTHSFFPAPGGFYVDNQVQVADSLGYSAINGNVYITDSVLIPEGFEEEYCTAG